MTYQRRDDSHPRETLSIRVRRPLADWARGHGSMAGIRVPRPGVSVSDTVEIALEEYIRKRHADDPDQMRLTPKEPAPSPQIVDRFQSLMKYLHNHHPSTLDEWRVIRNFSEEDGSKSE
jgi:hypothetical protein